MVNTILRYSAGGGRGNDRKRIRSTKGRYATARGQRKWVRSQTGIKSSIQNGSNAQGNNVVTNTSWRRPQDKGQNEKESEKDDTVGKKPPTTLEAAPSHKSMPQIEDTENSKESQAAENMQKYGKHKLVLLKSNKTGDESINTTRSISNGKMERHEPLTQAKEAEGTLKSSGQSEPSFKLAQEKQHDVGGKGDSVSDTRMFHQGSNKLILSESLKNTKKPVTSLSSKESRGLVPKTASEGILKSEQLESFSTSFMKRCGTHKLVLDKSKLKTLSVDCNEEGSAQPTAVASNDCSSSVAELHQSHNTVPSSGSSQEVNLTPLQEIPSAQSGNEDDTQGKKVVNMVHRGANQLVLCNPTKPSQGMTGKSTNWMTSKLKPKVMGKHSRHPYRTGNDSKRIKLVQSDVPDTSEGDGQRGNQPKLTDHAYRETSKSTRYNPGPKNMGLVRVQSNQSSTRICRTILRGLPCEDVHCRLRHDIPREHAMPVCSFFQKDGHCFRGSECPFRHVRVNPRAMICPTFALLSYCEDKDCVMQHIHQKRKLPKEIDSHRTRR